MKTAVLMRPALALLLLLTATLAPTAPAAANAQWGERADTALARAAQLEGSAEGVMYHSMMAGALAEREGWSSPNVARHLEAIYAQRLASGGYGLPYAWDAFQDGTVNSAQTTYAITVSGHAGRVLLDGWEAGVVPGEEVARLVDVIIAMPRIKDGGPGICIAYSSSANDVQPGYCVYNIVASAGKFLADARALGIVRRGQDYLLAGLTQRDASAYRFGTGYWPYRSGSTALADWNHNAVNVEAELALSPALGRDALVRQMSWSDPVRWVDPLGQVALLQYRCSSAPDLLDDFDLMLADSRVTAPLAAQMAYWSAQTSTHC